MVCVIGNSAVIDGTATGADNGFAPTGAGYKLFDKSEFEEPLGPVKDLDICLDGRGREWYTINIFFIPLVGQEGVYHV